jgi:hypothetical protein
VRVVHCHLSFFRYVVPYLARSLTSHRPPVRADVDNLLHPRPWQSTGVGRDPPSSYFYQIGIGVLGGSAMQKVLEYEQHAAECRQKAAEMTNPKSKKELEHMAEVWERLAQERRRGIVENHPNSR